MKWNHSINAHSNISASGYCVDVNFHEDDSGLECTKRIYYTNLDSLSFQIKATLFELNKLESLNIEPGDVIVLPEDPSVSTAPETPESRQEAPSQEDNNKNTFSIANQVYKQYLEAIRLAYVLDTDPGFIQARDNAKKLWITDYLNVL